MTGGETLKHSSLKTLALAWAREQGMFIAAPEVSFPHRKFRVDVAACAPTRKTPARVPAKCITSVLKVAAVFECKQVRSDLIRDNKRRDMIAIRLKKLEARRLELEKLLYLHLPHLAIGESLFPEFDSYRLRDYRHAPYQKLMKNINVDQRALIHGTKFHRLLSYRMANLHYLVVEEALLASHEVPLGWGLIVRTGEALELVCKPTWQDIPIEEQLVFLQRIASRKA
jgi:hypothetical protein